MVLYNNVCREASITQPNQLGLTMEAANENYASTDVPFPDEHLDIVLRYWRDHYAPRLTIEECQWRALPRLRQLRLPVDDMLQCVILAMEWDAMSPEKKRLSR